MKRLVIIIGIALGVFCPAFGQNTYDKISLCVYLPNNTDVPEAAYQYLENRLNTLASAEGNADFGLCGRFLLTAKVDVLQKDIVSGPPQKISQTLSVTLQIGDVEEHKLFASTTLTLVGIGTNLAKSYMEAFKHITKSEKQIQDFLQKGKNKVLAYYSAQCESICKKAEQLAAARQYGEALYNLASIPDIDKTCSQKSQTLMADIVKLKIDSDGRDLLNKAKLAWNKAQDRLGAEQATAFLVHIHPSADCQLEVEALVEEMKVKLSADAERDWQFQMQQYDDRVKQEQQQTKNEYELRKMRIKAARDAAVAFAENLPQQEILFLW